MDMEARRMEPCLLLRGRTGRERHDGRKQAQISGRRDEKSDAAEMRSTFSGGEGDEKTEEKATGMERCSEFEREPLCILLTLSRPD